jgi:hypothetical protein
MSPDRAESSGQLEGIALSAIMTAEVRLGLSAKFKLESLILAQDERWRRA